MLQGHIVWVDAGAVIVVYLLLLTQVLLLCSSDRGTVNECAVGDYVTASVSVCSNSGFVNDCINAFNTSLLAF